MRAGALDRPVEIRTPVDRTEANGDVTTFFALLSKAWAARTDGPGTERFVAEEVYGETTAVFEIRYLRGVSPRCRLIDEVGAEYDILGVQEIGRRQGLRLACRARAEETA